MIRTDKKDKNYKLIDYTDILLGIAKASKLEDSEMVQLLCETFDDMESENVVIDTKTYKRVKSNDKVTKFLMEKANIIDYDTYIDHDILKDAFVRSYFEFNHEMKNKLSTYFRKYSENEIMGIDNTFLKEEIKNDKEAMKYIKKYDNYSMYIEDKILKNIEMNEKLDRKVKKING